MPNSVLYAGTVLIWGTTWFAISFQLGYVAVEVSILYRYAIATLVLLAICMARKTPLKFSAHAHKYMLIQGTCLFCLNYIFFYYASVHLTTGLVAVIFSTVVLMNVLNGRLIVGLPIRPVVVLSGILGLIGLVFIFIPELSNMERSEQVRNSILFGLVATLFASIGNVTTIKNKENGVPIVAATTWGMFYGSIVTLAYVLVKVNFDGSTEYVVSLIYLSVFGSVVAFLCYLTLIEKIGPDKASYSGVMFPVVALIVSTIFEDYRWTATAVFGLALVILGNFLVLRAK